MKVLQILKESSPPDLMKGFEEFLPLVMNVLGINKLPPIKIVKDVPGSQPSFGGFDQDSGIIYIQVTNRHPLDIFRTLAHELVHFKQDSEHKLDGESGRTGSPMENEANATAGIVMRHFNKQYPEYLGQTPLIKEDVNESLTPNTIHKLADRKGVKWDNEPSFLKLTKQLTGKEHLDDLDQADLQKVKRYLEKQGVAEGATVTRIDSKPITDFGSSLKAYKHTDDWSQSGVDTGDDSYWKNKNLKTNTTKGLFAGDPKRTALYATGNAHETRYVEFTQNGQPIVYFDQKDLPAMRSRKTYLTVFDANDFRQLPTGEWFSENPGKPIKQIPIGDPFKYIASQGWIVRVTDDLDKVFKQVKNMHKAGKIAQYGAEGMNESKQGVAENFADGKNPGRKGLAKRSGVNTKASVSSLRKTAKNSSGEKQRMAHWLANMKAGRAK